MPQVYGWGRKPLLLERIWIGSNTFIDGETDNLALHALS
jgi:hypothetical protein